MIKGNRKLALQDLSNRGNDVSLEVNWNRSRAVKNCKHIKVKIGDGAEAIISQNHLFALLMAISPPKEQERMVENYMDYQEVRNHQTVVDIKASVDIQKGQIFSVPMTISVNSATGEVRIKP